MFLGPGYSNGLLLLGRLFGKALCNLHTFHQGIWQWLFWNLKAKSVRSVYPGFW